MNRTFARKGEQGRGRAIFVTFVLLLCLSTVIFLGVGRWLVREDPLEKGGAIVVLSGGIPDRALQAAKIYREGYGSEIWLTQPVEPKRTMVSLGVSFDGEEEINRRVLLHEGVHPCSCCVTRLSDQCGVID